MLITKVERKYSKSINTKNYGLPESWIKVEASYEAQIESSDDPVHCSALLYDAAKNDVVGCVNDLVTRMRGVGAPSPVTPVAATPVAAVAPSPIPYNENPATGEINIAATPAELFPSSGPADAAGIANPAPAGVSTGYAAGVPTAPGYSPRPL